MGRRLYTYVDKMNKIHKRYLENYETKLMGGLV